MRAPLGGEGRRVSGPQWIVLVAVLLGSPLLPSSSESKRVSVYIRASFRLLSAVRRMRSEGSEAAMRIPGPEPPRAEHSHEA